MLYDVLWPANREFHEVLKTQLKSKVHDKFGDHEFDKKVDHVRKIALETWHLTRLKHLKLMDDVLDDASLVVYNSSINSVKVHVEPNTRKKTISIGLRAS